MNIAGILKNIDTNVLSEDAAASIAAAFNEAVDTKVSERINLEKEKVLKEQDEDHALKLKKLLEAIDKDHTQKLQRVVEAVTLNHTQKLQKISSFYDKALKEKAEQFSDNIVSEMSNYLDLYLNKIIPQEQLAEAVANVSAKRQLSEIKRILAFDKDSIPESVQKVILNGKKKVDLMSQELKNSLQENKNLKAEMSQIKSSLFLEQKTKGMPASKKAFVVKLLEDKPLTYIKENFNYVIEMFEREERQIPQVLVKEAKETAVSKDAKVVKPIVESKDEQKFGSAIGEYLSYLKGNR